MIKSKGHGKDFANDGVGDYVLLPTGVPGPISLAGIARWKEKKSNPQEMFPFLKLSHSFQKIRVKIRTHTTPPPSYRSSFLEAGRNK